MSAGAGLRSRTAAKTAALAATNTRVDWMGSVTIAQ
jgi:hypothetical protein